jgi:hypothetical protein
MENLQELLELIVNELPLKDFIKACENAGLNYKEILDRL